MEGEGEMDLADLGGAGDQMAGTPSAAGSGHPRKDESKSFTVTGF